MIPGLERMRKKGANAKLRRSALQKPKKWLEALEKTARMYCQDNTRTFSFPRDYA